jgi:hypothetical protein
MKTVWIVLGVLAALGLACCGGIFFLGKGAIGAVTEITKGADVYSAKIFPEIAQDWDFDLVRKESSPEFQKQVSDETMRGLLKLYKTKLGKFKSVGPFTSNNIQVKTANGDNVTLVTTKARAEFEHGAADAELECIKRGETWKLLGITMRSDKLIQ